jgi:hypothetical protein
MHSPPLRGRCPRRALFTWRIDPVAARRVVPAPLRPKILHGAAIGAVDWIRLERLRPRLIPGPLGLSMEMCTHLIPAEWDDNGVRRDVLYVLRRDVQVSGLGRAAGLLLPGHPNPASIKAIDEDTQVQVSAASKDGVCQLELGGVLAGQWQNSPLFSSGKHLMHVLGNQAGGFLAFDENGDGALIELEAHPELAEPLDVLQHHSSLFDGGILPKGAAQPDAAVVLRNLVCLWSPRGKVLRASQRKAMTATNGEGGREPWPAQSIAASRLALDACGYTGIPRRVLTNRLAALPEPLEFK